MFYPYTNQYRYHFIVVCLEIKIGTFYLVLLSIYRRSLLLISQWYTLMRHYYKITYYYTVSSDGWNGSRICCQLAWLVLVLLLLFLFFFFLPPKIGREKKKEGEGTKGRKGREGEEEREHNVTHTHTLTIFLFPQSLLSLCRGKTSGAAACKILLFFSILVCNL